MVVQLFESVVSPKVKIDLEPHNIRVYLKTNPWGTYSGGYRKPTWARWSFGVWYHLLRRKSYRFFF